jgi:hypothetical protein
MPGHGEKVTRKQQQAIAALLAEPSIRKAALACSVDESTLRKWLKNPTFLSEYRSARRAVVEAAVGQLQRAAGAAVKTLRKALGCPNASVAVRSALGILDRAFAGVELLDHEMRLAELEKRLAESQNGGGRRGHW